MALGINEIFEWQIEIMPADIDNLGHVNNVVYLRWVQEAAAAHWNTLASPVLKNEMVWVVLRHEINYHKPAFLHDRIIAKTWVGETAGFRSVRHVEIYNSLQVLLASASTTWCPLDPVSGRPKKITTEILESLTGKKV
jgi:acyl-CoA thioester hydrolase